MTTDGVRRRCVCLRLHEYVPSSWVDFADRFVCACVCLFLWCASWIAITLRYDASLRLLMYLCGGRCV